MEHRSNSYFVVNFLLLGSIFVKMSFSVWIAFHYLIIDSKSLKDSFTPYNGIDSNSSLTSMDKNLVLQNNDDNNELKDFILIYLMTSNIVQLFGLLAICLEYKTLLFLFGMFSIILVPLSIGLINSLNIFLPSVMNFLNANLSFMLVKKIHSGTSYHRTSVDFV